MERCLNPLQMGCDACRSSSIITAWSVVDGAYETLLCAALDSYSYSLSLSGILLDGI